MIWCWNGLANISNCDASSQPVLALRIQQGEGYSYNSFVLYENGELIVQQRNEPPGYAYSHIHLTRSEYEQFLQRIPKAATLYALDSHYNLTQRIVHGEVMQYFYIHLTETPKYINAYGGLVQIPLKGAIETLYRTLQKRCPPTEHRLPLSTHLRKARSDALQASNPPLETSVCGVQIAVSDILKAFRGGIALREENDLHRKYCPTALRELFDTLVTYHHPQAERWLPEHIEVIIWPASQYFPDLIEWTASWPGFDDPSTQKWTDGSGRYSLFLDSRHFKELQQRFGFAGDILNLDGKSWIARWRFPFPGEEAWMQGWGKYPQ